MSLFSLDSSSLPSQAKKVDCHDLPSKSRNDNALFPSLRGSGDSHNEAIQPQSSLRGSEATEAIHKDKTDSSAKVDCHDLPSKSRNDSTAQDSRINKNHTNSTNATRRQDFAMILWVVKRWAKGFT